MNKRRGRYRRRAAVAAARMTPFLYRKSRVPAPERLRRFYRLLPVFSRDFMQATGRFYANSRQTAAALAGNVLAVARTARDAVIRYGRLSRRGGSIALARILAGLRAINESLVSAVRRVWLAANRDVEFPEARLRPYLQVATGLFALIAVSAAGFSAWHILRGNPAPEPPSFASLRDHHPPSAVIAASEMARDAETEFVSLPFGSENEPVLLVPSVVFTEPRDIDEQNWFDIGLAVPDGVAEDSPVAAADEENLVTALAGLSPRAVPRPETPDRPAVTGIPVHPEPPFGTVPARPAWLANAVQPLQHGNGPMIAIVIDDAGVVQHRTRRASDLPAPVTIAFIPYSDNLQSQTRYARAQGHELLLHMPMEPGSTSIDPGHNALLTTLGREEVMRRFRWALVHGTAGICPSRAGGNQCTRLAVPGFADRSPYGRRGTGARNRNAQRDAQYLPG
jgi:hypothetical protein